MQYGKRCRAKSKFVGQRLVLIITKSQFEPDGRVENGVCRIGPRQAAVQPIDRKTNGFTLA